MKVVGAVLGMIFCCLIFSCAQPVDLEQSETEVKNLLDQYITGVELEDMGQYSAIVCHDAEMVNFGAFGAPIVGWDGLQAVMECHTFS